jgi:hypothetical protein
VPTGLSSAGVSNGAGVVELFLNEVVEGEEIGVVVGPRRNGMTAPRLRILVICTHFADEEKVSLFANQIVMLSFIQRARITLY